ncbi:SulP family inorganic anion transporter [Nocardioides sp. NPDC023903]|uniref:SulP family inorganic anion transporter n=1 Tax=Nocardioides sp. NPDC023903 TaxID=3157195 RepID=UPI0033FD0D42
MAKGDMDPDPDGRTSLRRLYAGSLRRTQARAERVLRREVREITPQKRHWRRDLVAGLPGAIASVPDGMASSVLAGVNPTHGLYASFAGPIAGGLSSSTRMMVVTTTSASALAAGSVLAGHDPDDRSAAMLLLTIVAGGVMLLAALFKLSRYIRFVSYSVMLGFLTGVSVNIVLGQLPDIAGVDAEGPFAAAKAWDLLTRLDESSLPTVATGLGALLLLLVLAPTRLAVASPLVALVVPTVTVLVTGADVVSVEDSGKIPQGLPVPQLPDLSLLDMDMVTGAIAIAALVLIQGAGVSEAVPNPDGSRSSTRRDFTAQGLANVASGFFGGQPVGGSVGQTALNATAGAASRWGAIWTGIWMAVILVLLSGIVGKVAMPTLAAVLIYAGAASIRPREVVSVARTGVIPAVAMTATFVAVLLLPVAQAVGIGVIASLLLQLRQDSLDLRLVRIERDEEGRFIESPVPRTLTRGELVVLEAYGSLFYAGARTLQRLLPLPPEGPEPEQGEEAATAVVLRLRGRTTLGATFLKVVGDYARDLDGAGARLYLSGVDPELVEHWSADGTLRRLSGVHIEPATQILGESTHAAVVASREPPSDRPE